MPKIQDKSKTVFINKKDQFKEEKQLKLNKIKEYNEMIK